MEAKDNFWKFVKLYLPNYFQDTPAKFHYEIIALLQQDKANKRIAIAAPRKHAKSTLIAKGYLLREILLGEKKFIVYISSTYMLARSCVSDVKFELQNNEQILADYGNVIGQRKDTEGEFVTKNGKKVLAVSAGGKVRGLLHLEHRPDLIVLDDIEDDEHVRKSEQRRKLIDWFNKALLPAGDYESDIIVIGTILHAFGLLATLLDENKSPGWDTRLYRAINAGEPIWPERYDNEWLDAECKRIGPSAFACEYMNNPVDEGIAVFRQEWLRYYDKEPEGLDVRIGVDPALGQKKEHDYFCAMTVGRDKKTKNLYLLDVYRKRDTTQNHVNAIIRLYLKYSPSKIGIETVAFQELLKEQLERQARESGIYLPTRGIKNHTNKRLRIEKLQSLFERGEVFIRRGMEDFIQEYTLYPSVDHDDQLDALEMAVSSFKGFVGVA